VAAAIEARVCNEGEKTVVEMAAGNDISRLEKKEA
jgi:hypothetical protein